MSILLVIGVGKNYLEPDCTEKLVENWTDVTLVEPLLMDEVFHVSLFVINFVLQVRAFSTRDLVRANAP